MAEETKEETFERDTKLNIHQRINAVMADCNYIKKGKQIKNAKGVAMYNVTGHDAVTKLIHPLFVKHGINLIPSFHEMTEEVVLVKKYEKVMEMHRVRLDATFQWINIDDPKDFFEQSWSGYGCDDTDKGPGKAISYAQRYVVLKTLHIETGENDLEEDEPPLIPHSASVKKQLEQQDIPLSDGSQISDGSTISAELQIMVKKAFISKKMGTEDQKVILDSFMVDKLEEILNSDYEKVIKTIRGA